MLLAVTEAVEPAGNDGTLSRARQSYAWRTSSTGSGRGKRLLLLLFRCADDGGEFLMPSSAVSLGVVGVVGVVGAVVEEGDVLLAKESRYGAGDDMCDVCLVS